MALTSRGSLWRILLDLPVAKVDDDGWQGGWRSRGSARHATGLSPLRRRKAVTVVLLLKAKHELDVAEQRHGAGSGTTAGLVSRRPGRFWGLSVYARTDVSDELPGSPQKRRILLPPLDDLGNRRVMPAAASLRRHRISVELGGDPRV